MVRVACLLASCFSLVAVGCGGSNFPTPVPVSGKVLHKGKPVEGAKVTFLSKSEGARPASGRTNSDGEFALTTFRTDDGAIPGDYAVTIAKLEAKPGSESIDASGDSLGDDYDAMMAAAASGVRSKALGENALPEKYGNAAESGLERTIAEDQPNEFEFDLE